LFFRRGEPRPATEKIETVIGLSVRLRGRLKAKGGIRVDGHLTGKVETESNIIVGENARVIADVTGINVTVAGVIQGNVKAAGRLEILSTGAVIGDVSVGALLIEEGGTFRGQSLMEQPAAAAQKGAPPKKVIELPARRAGPGQKEAPPTKKVSSPAPKPVSRKPVAANGGGGPGDERVASQGKGISPAAGRTGPPKKRATDQNKQAGAVQAEAEQPAKQTAETEKAAPVSTDKPVLRGAEAAAAEKKPERPDEVTKPAEGAEPPAASEAVSETGHDATAPASTDDKSKRSRLKKIFRREEPSEPQDETKPT
jgi:cytoskeletal protein CcmA (bactofilin family)